MLVRFSAKATLAALALATLSGAGPSAAQGLDEPLSQAPSQAPAPIAQTPLGFEGQALSALDPWSVGAISRAQGGLPANMWAQSEPSVLALVFQRLPTVYESPAARDLARRVLLSGGDAPRGDSTVAARGRFQALGKMGAADDLGIMAAGLGGDGGGGDPEIAQYAAQAELSRGRRPQACGRERLVQTEAPTPFMLRLRAFCAAAGGDRAAADLALELAQSSGAGDAWYSAATAAAGGAPGARPPAARYDTSLNVQLSLAGNLTPGRLPLADSSTLALVGLARAENAPQPIRAQAAALAFRRGVLSAREARTILRATPAETTSGLPPLVDALRRIDAAIAAGEEQARAQAASLAAAQAAAQSGAEPPPVVAPTGVSAELQIAATIADMLRQASDAADFAAVAAFFKEEIDTLNTAPDPAAALLLARAAVVSGDLRLAQRLVDGIAEAGVEAAALAPLQAALGAYRGPRGNGAQFAVARRIDSGGASMARAAARDVVILSALGFELDGAAQAFLMANPPQGGVRADAGVMAILRAAVERRSLGEALLLIVVASENGPALLDAESLAQLIGSLRALGFEEEARRFAVEALLAGQPS
jgi:hypothetical protein